MPADVYRQAVIAYNKFKQDYGNTDAKGHYVMTPATYSATSFTTLYSNLIVTNKPKLLPSTRSVVVRGKQTMLTANTNPVLLESVIDLSRIDNDVMAKPDIQSLIMRADGTVLKSSERNIGFRAATIKQKSGEADPLCRPAYDIKRDGDGYNPAQDALCGPVKGASVRTQIFPGQYSGVTTDDQGRWAITYFKSPCPGFDYRYTTDFYQTLFYTNFNPKGSAQGEYFQHDSWTDTCRGLSEALAGSTSLNGLMTGLAVSALESSTAEGPRHMLMNVDVTAVSGLGMLANPPKASSGFDLQQPVDVGSGTEYVADIAATTRLDPKTLGLEFDLDGDGKPDPVEVKDYNSDGTQEVGLFLNGVPSARPRSAGPLKIGVFLKHSASAALILVQAVRECRCFWGAKHPRFRQHFAFFTHRRNDYPRTVPQDRHH